MRLLHIGLVIFPEVRLKNVIEGVNVQGKFPHHFISCEYPEESTHRIVPNPAETDCPTPR